jgi:hypothetical protein
VSESEQVVADLREAGAGVAAVAMVAVFGPLSGWSATWVNALGELRCDADLDVRLAARAVWLAAT